MRDFRKRGLGADSLNVLLWRLILPAVVFWVLPVMFFRLGFRGLWCRGLRRGGIWSRRLLRHRSQTAAESGECHRRGQGKYTSELLH